MKCSDCKTLTRWGKVEVSFEYQGIRLCITGIEGMVCPKCGKQYVPGPQAITLSRAAEEIFQAQESYLASGKVA